VRELEAMGAATGDGQEHARKLRATSRATLKWKEKNKLFFFRIFLLRKPFLVYVFRGSDVVCHDPTFIFFSARGFDSP
jgi:hypothetical protein